MSTILGNTFKLTKDIEHNPKRDSIKLMLSELLRSDITGGEIGYHGSQMYRQFLGYLRIYNDRDRINRESFIKINELPSETIDLLTFGHQYIKSVNSLLLMPLLEMIPNAYKIIDPYWIYENHKNKYAEIDISSPSLNALVESFRLSKPFQIIKNRLNYAPQLKDIKEQDIANAVYSIIERIKKSGLKHCPDDLFETSLKINNPNPESIVSAIILCLINIHSSLQVIDQLLYQAFSSDKMISLDENNIYNVLHMGSNFISESIEVCSCELVHIPGVVIVIDLPFDKLPQKKKFCMVEQVQMKFSQEYGNEFIVGARCIDDCASSYPNLVNNIKLL